MNQINTFRFSRLWPTIALTLALCSHAVAADEPNRSVLCDPAKVIGSDQCTKCHQAEMQQWMRTPHFATFETQHRKPEAKQIADRLGRKSIKRNETCTRCHYTEQQQGERTRVVAGVSCESCHGAAADWVAIHNDYGGPNVTKLAESPAHREERLATSIARGMNNPHNVYLIARQCYNCHTAPDESLVNVGGHTAGSADFELVAWSQGTMRHNFQRTGGATNAASTPAELRVMYVVGVMTDLEYSLRATVLATTKATFGIASAQRAVRMKHRLGEIQSLINDPKVQAALDATETVDLKINNAAALSAAADKVSAAAHEYAESTHGEQLTPLDPLLPQPTQYKN